MHSSRMFEERQCVLLKVFTLTLANSSSKTVLVDIKVVHNRNSFGIEEAHRYLQVFFHT